MPCQHLTLRQPRPWQPAGSPCSRRALSGCAAGAEAGWMQTRSGHTAQRGGTGHSGHLDVAVTPPGPTPKPTVGCAERSVCASSGDCERHRQSHMCAAGSRERLARAPHTARGSARLWAGGLQPKEAPALPLRCWKGRQQAHREPCTDGCGTRGPCQPHAMSFDGCANKSGARWSPPHSSAGILRSLPAPTLAGCPTALPACPGCVHNAAAGIFMVSRNQSALGGKGL